MLCPLGPIRQLVQSMQVGPRDERGTIGAHADVEAGPVRCICQIKTVLLLTVVRILDCHCLVKSDACRSACTPIHVKSHQKTS